MTGLTVFGFSTAGQARASRYRPIHSTLAQMVYRCYILSEEQAEGFAKPCAEILATYLPDDWLVKAAAGVSPIEAVGCLYVLIRQCRANEQMVVKQFMDAERIRGAAENGPIPPSEEFTGQQQETLDQAA